MMGATAKFKLKPNLVGVVRRADGMIKSLMANGSTQWVTDDEFRKVLAQRKEAEKNGMGRCKDRA